MLFHPIINQLANLDMTFLVKPAENQCIEGQTACFCPFCQKEAANDDAGSKAKQTPHLIIYKDERGGLYNGVGVDDDRQAEHGAVRWMCTKTGKHGYGALELYAAMRNLPMHGASLLRLCHDLVVRVYGDAENVRAKYPMLFSKMDYRTIAVQNIDTFSFIPKVDFNPQELAALGCEVTMVKGLPSFGFGRDFNTKMLNDDFRIYAVDQVTLPNAVRDGKQVSEVIYGTPWNPLFVCFATDVIAPQGSCGCLFRPAMQQPPIVFSTTEEHSVKKVSRWLMGDKSLVVDVGLKKKYSVGGVEELKAGIGTHDRYVADLNSMLFGKKADVMINGGTNNIGDLESSQLSENGAGVADKKTMAVAGRFSFKGKTFDDNIRGDYTVGSDRGHQISRTATENYLQGGNLFTASDNDSHDKSSWITSRNFFCKRFKRQIVKASLMVFYNKSRQMGQSRSAMADVKPLDNTAWLDSLSQWEAATPSPFRGAINRVMAQNLTRQTTLNTLMSISSRLAFGKSKGRYGNMIDWSLRLKYNTGNGKTFNINDLYYFDEGSRDFRDNYYDKPSKSYSVNLQASYAHRLTSKADHVNSLFAYFSASVLHAYDTSDNNLYRLDQLADYTQGRYPLGMLPSAADDLFDVLDETNSSHNSSRNTMADGSLRLEMRHGDGMTRPQLTAKLTLPLTWQHERISYTQKRHYGKPRSSALFSPKVEAGYSRTDSLGTRSVNFNYATTPSLPQLLTLLGVRNDDDPLFIRLGNANLRQSRNHTFELTFNTMSNGKCNTSWALSTGANILQDALGTKVTYDRATGQTTSQQVNVNGNWSANASITLNRGLDANHNLDLSASLKSDYSRNVDLNHTATGSDDAKSKVYTLNTSGSLTFSYHKSRNFMAMLIATVNNNRVTGSRDDFMATNATTYFATAKVMVKLPLGFELTNNINEMKRTGFNDDSMNDNSLVWNARLSKTFLKGALSVNLDAFDILGQISQTQVVMDSQGRTETWANTLPRYVLLHCSYKLNLGKKR